MSLVRVQPGEQREARTARGPGLPASSPVATGSVWLMPTRGRSVDHVQDVTRRRTYFALMGACVVLIVLAWNVVRLWSTPAAVVMTLVAAVLPPVAVVVGNLGVLGRPTRSTDELPRRD